MENDLIYSDNAKIERSLKSKQTRLAIHGVGMVILSFHMYILGFIFNLHDLEFWFNLVFLSYDWEEWLLVLGANLFLLPRLLFLYRSYKAYLFGDKKKQLTDELKEKLIESEMYSFCLGVDRKNPYVSPVLGDYEGFPPTLFTVGGAEILLDDTRIIAKNMEEHGIKTKVISHELMFHIYPLYTGIFPESTEAYKEILKYISEQMK